MNNLPMNISNNFFYRIKNFFYNLFHKNTVKKYENMSNTIEEDTQNKKQREIFVENLSKNFKEQEEEKHILNAVNNNSEIIYTLSTKQLLKLIRIIQKG